MSPRSTLAILADLAHGLAHAVRVEWRLMLGRLR